MAWLSTSSGSRRNRPSNRNRRLRDELLNETLPVAWPSPHGAGGLENGLQYRQAAQRARPPNSGGIRSTVRWQNATGWVAWTRGRSRAPSHYIPNPNRNKLPKDSTNGWMKEGAQVNPFPDRQYRRHRSQATLLLRAHQRDH